MEPSHEAAIMVSVIVFHTYLLLWSIPIKLHNTNLKTINQVKTISGKFSAG